MKYVGGPPDIWTKCDPEVIWDSVTKAVWAFQGVWAEPSYVPALLLNDGYVLATTKYVSPQRMFYISLWQSPKFLSCSFIVFQHTATYSRPPLLQPLNQGHGTWFPENTATGNGKSCLNLKELLLPDFCTNTKENNTDKTDWVQILNLTEVANSVRVDKILLLSLFGTSHGRTKESLQLRKLSIMVIVIQITID